MMKKDTVIKVKIKPNAAKNKILDRMSDGTIKISIKKPPKKNKANKELINFLSKKINVSKDKIQIVRGSTSKLKIIKIINYSGEI